MKVVAFDLADRNTRARYDALFNDCPNAFIQQSTYWADIIADLGPDQPIFLLASEGERDVGGLPLYLFRAEPGPIINSVPQPGPLGGVFCHPSADREPVYAALLKAADGLARSYGCLALTIITNPMENDVDLYERHLAHNLTFENFTQVVRLENAVADGCLIVRNNKKANPGATIRKAEAAGFSIKHCSNTNEFDTWYAIHRQRASEIGLTPLNEMLVRRIWRDLGEKGNAFLQLVMAGEEIAAGCLFILHRDICDVFAVSMNSKHADNAPNYLAIKAALIEMARRGVRFMNWQSSPKRNDGVYKFKKQWGSEERPYFFVTKTYREDACILDLGPAGVKAAYSDHFLVPFGVFESGHLAGKYAKQPV